MRWHILLASIPAAFQEAGAHQARRPQPPRPAAAPQLAGDNLFKALYRGDGETARKLIEQNPSLVNARFEYGENLHSSVLRSELSNLKSFPYKLFSSAHFFAPLR